MMSPPTTKSSTSAVQTSRSSESAARVPEDSPSSAYDVSSKLGSSPRTTAPRHQAMGAGFAHDATGAHPKLTDKVLGNAEIVAGKVTKDSRKVIVGRTRKAEGKEGVQAAEAEGVL